jgi:signal transduction histidine kinase
MRKATAVGQHQLFRGLLLAVGATLLASGVLILGAGILMDQHLGQLARAMAMRVVPGARAAQDLDLAVGDRALAAVLAVGGDERVLEESSERVDSAARAYDGWARGVGLTQLLSVEPVVQEFEERISIATRDNQHIDEGQIQAAIGEVTSVLRINGQLAADDTIRKLDDIAECQQRRRLIELLLLGLLSGGCLSLLAFARRREQRTCEAEAAAMRGLEQNNADLEAFAGRVAHDLRNPLAPILSGSQIIEKLPGEPQAKRAAERIERSARRLARMIDMLLDFSRVASATSIAECEVAPIIEDVVEGFREKARTEGVRIDVEAEPLTAACEPIVVASPLQNLIENAIKYGRRPDAEPVVSVRAYRDEAHVVLEVEDRGPGIRASEVEQMFHAFSRGVSGGEGVGLGLATARRLVESRGGRIRLLGGRFGGALFEIRLPSPGTSDVSREPETPHPDDAPSTPTPTASAAPRHVPAVAAEARRIDPPATGSQTADSEL